MKNYTKVLGAMSVVCLVAAGANAQIRNSGHDFSANAWSGGEICKPCHTPHFANSEAGALWNHALTNATYTLFEGDPGTVEDFDRVSRLCMSCHDGTVALDSFGGATGTSFIPGSANIGTDLQNDHPVGSEAVYPTAGTAGRFNAATYVTTGGPPSYRLYNPANASQSLRLASYTPTGGTEEWVVGCSTCHQVHNSGNYSPMLRFSNSGSNLCLACHIK